VTVEGMDTDTRSEQLSKAFLPILITAVYMDIILAELQPGSYLVTHTTTGCTLGLAEGPEVDKGVGLEVNKAVGCEDVGKVEVVSEGICVVPILGVCVGVKVEIDEGILEAVLLEVGFRVGGETFVGFDVGDLELLKEGVAVGVFDGERELVDFTVGIVVGLKEGSKGIAVGSQLG